MDNGQREPFVTEQRPLIHRLKSQGREMKPKRNGVMATLNLVFCVLSIHFNSKAGAMVPGGAIDREGQLDRYCAGEHRSHPVFRCIFCAVRGLAVAASQWKSEKKGVSMTINLGLAPLVSLLAGILILAMPRLLNSIVAIYLIVIGLIGIFGGSNLRL